MLPRAEQKQQTRNALMDAARHLMECGRGFGSLSLREVTRTAGIVPTGFYRHFADMDELGLVLVSEVGQTFRETIRLVRHNEFVMGGIIDASVRIFLDVVSGQSLAVPVSRPRAVRWLAAGAAGHRPFARRHQLGPGGRLVLDAETATPGHRRPERHG